LAKDVLNEIAEGLNDDEVRMEYGEELAKLDFALALIRARKEQSLTQQQLADLLGVSQAYIARLESGSANPTLGKAGRILASLWRRPLLNPGHLVEPGQLEKHSKDVSPIPVSKRAKPKILR
jgi:transcriptional regulator with XRE-family HTH domain